MTLRLAFHGRRIRPAVSESIGLVLAARESRIDLAVEFLLDDPTAARGRLEFGRNAQVLGAPRPESSNALDADPGYTADVLAIGKAFQCLE